LIPYKPVWVSDSGTSQQNQKKFWLEICHFAFLAYQPSTLKIVGALA
jgi:hypothetical protein